MNTAIQPIVFASVASALIFGATNAFAQQAPSRGSSGSQVLRTFGPTNALAIPASAETPIRFWSRTGSKVRIEGTSTFTDWTAEGGMINGYIELDPHFPLDPNAKVEVEIPVTSLLSVKNLKDAVMYEALKQKQYPKIVYRLKGISLKPSAQPDSLQFDAVGELSVAGMLRTNSMVVTMETLGETRLKVRGKTGLKMSAFGIKPPSRLGLIKTGDDVKVSFEWVTGRNAIESASIAGTLISGATNAMPQQFQARPGNQPEVTISRSREEVTIVPTPIKPKEEQPLNSRSATEVIRPVVESAAKEPLQKFQLNSGQSLKL